MNLAQILLTAQNILNAIIPVLVSLGVVFFIWGVVQYVIAGGDEAKKKGKDRIIYGIIALAIIVSLWGIVNVVIETFDIGGAVPKITSTENRLCNSIGRGTGILSYSRNEPKEAFIHAAGYITCTIRNSIIPFMFALALAVFVWGVVKFFFINADEEAKRSQGKQFMIWGIVALTVMLSVWGLVRVLSTTFGISFEPPKTQE